MVAHGIDPFMSHGAVTDFQEYPNMSHEAMMTAVVAPECTGRKPLQGRGGVKATMDTAAAASTCAVVHPHEALMTARVDERTGGELLRRPMNFGLFSSEAPPTWSRAEPIDHEAMCRIGIIKEGQILYYYYHRHYKHYGSIEVIPSTGVPYGGMML